MARSLVSTLHTNSVVQSTIAAAATKILGVEDYNVDPQLETEIAHAAGDHRPSYVALMSYSPIVVWSCSDLANALGLIHSLDGKAITGGTDTLDFFFVKKLKQGTRTSGANHQRGRMFESFSILEEITAAQGSHAVGRFRSAGIYDGTNEPLTMAGSIALPSAISNLTEMFKLGKIDVSGTNVDGVVSVTYRTGIELDIEFAGGDHRPTWVGIKRREPKVEITTLEVPYFTTLTPKGAKGTTAWSGYLYKMDEFGDVVADATAQHIKFSGVANHYRVGPGALTVRQNENGTFTTTLTCAHDGTNDEWTLSTASAVT